MLTYVVVGSAVLGSVAGLVLPRPIFRLSVATGVPCRSYCVHCDTPLRQGSWGWVAVGNRCRTCEGDVGPRWLPMSAVLAVASSALAWRLPATQPDDVAVLVAWLVMLYAGTLLAGIDLKVRRLPTPIIAVTAVVTVVLIGTGAALSRRPQLLFTAVVAAALLGVAYLLLALVAGSGMGMGDVRLAALLGLMLGTVGWTTVLVGALLPYLLAVPSALMRLALHRAYRSTHLPFGPFLVTGAVLAALLTAW